MFFLENHETEIPFFFVRVVMYVRVSCTVVSVSSFSKTTLYIASTSQKKEYGKINGTGNYEIYDVYGEVILLYFHPYVLLLINDRIRILGCGKKIKIVD